MDGINMVLSVIILINLMLVVVSSSGHKKSRVGLAHSVYLLNITTVVWWLGSMVFHRISNQVNIDYTSRNLYASATFIASSFYYFSFMFPNLKNEHRGRLFGVVLINIALVVFIFLTPLFIKGGSIVSVGENVSFFGTYYVLYVAYILYFFCSSFYRLFLKYKKTVDKEIKAQLLYLFTGYTISGFIAFVTNLLLPSINNFEYIWLGPASTIFLAIAITSAVTRHHLFNIKIIATEIFVFVLWVFTLIKISAFEPLEPYEAPATFGHSVTHVLFLLVSIIVGILLIKSIRKQVEQHEENIHLVHQLAVANKQLREVDEVKSKFVSLARHQMASPLTAINAYSSLLNDKDIDLDKIGLKSLQGIIDRFIVIVRDFLAISQIESGEVAYSKEVVDLKQVINNVLCDNKITLDQHNIEADLQINSDENYSVLCDKEKITTAISNIVDNSIQYSTSSTIAINLSNTKSLLTITIRDHGVRTLPEISPTLLKKFSSEGDGFEATLMGNGLGVYISKCIIQAHGGDLKIQKPASADFSCEFIITLPKSDLMGQN
ncbi:MAG: ATP-binding protein [bacterium]